MRWPQEGGAHQPASSPATEPSAPTWSKRRQESPETLTEPEEEYTNCLPHCPAANLASIGSNWSWFSKPWTSPTGYTKRLKQMAIQRLNSLDRFETDALVGWGTGDDSSNCGPFQKELAWTSNRHKCIGVTLPTSGGLPNLPSRTSKCDPNEFSHTQSRC